MSKELDYEFNNFANLLHKDCMNLMECLKKQSEDNKPILYLGKHYEKVILPYEEYQKMYKRLESIDNANSSEALECLMYLKAEFRDYPSAFNSIKNALLKAQKEHKALEIIKEKNVDIALVKAVNSVEQYNKIYVYDHMLDIKWCLAEEEFYLLKEVLE